MLFKGSNISCTLQPSAPGKKPKELFKDLNIKIEKGDIIDLIGPSGSGKSTLLMILARMHPVESANLFLNGKSSNKISALEWRRKVALVPQKAVTFPGSVRENLRKPWSLSVRKSSKEAMSKAPTDKDLRKALDRVLLDDVLLDQDASRLSVGQIARISFLRSILTKPEVLLLDEVDAALDSKSAKEVALYVAELAKAGEFGCLRVRHREPDGVETKRLRIENKVLVEDEIAGETK